MLKRIEQGIAKKVQRKPVGARSILLQTLQASKGFKGLTAGKQGN